MAPRPSCPSPAPSQGGGRARRCDLTPRHATWCVDRAPRSSLTVCDDAARIVAPRPYVLRCPHCVHDLNTVFPIRRPQRLAARPPAVAPRVGICPSPVASRGVAVRNVAISPRAMPHCALRTLRASLRSCCSRRCGPHGRGPTRTLFARFSTGGSSAPAHPPSPHALCVYVCSSPVACLVVVGFAARLASSRASRVSLSLSHWPAALSVVWRRCAQRYDLAARHATSRVSCMPPRRDVPNCPCRVPNSQTAFAIHHEQRLDFRPSAVAPMSFSPIALDVAGCCRARRCDLAVGHAALCAPRTSRSGLVVCDDEARIVAPRRDVR